jgi:hypothetical protein
MARAKKVKVIVTVNSDVPGDFTIEPSPKGSLPQGKKGILEFKNDHHPGFNIHFDLVDKSGLGFKFPPSDKMRSAVWSELGATSCPQDGKMEVFEPVSIDNDQTTLVVHNPNAGTVVGAFYYMLRVTNDGGRNYLELDPGGTNKNGPIAPLANAWMAPTVAGAIVAVGTVLLVSNSFVPATVATFAIGGAVVGLIVGLVLGRR